MKFFISFSYEGENQGVIQSEGKSIEKVLKKNKKILPKYDHVRVFELTKLEDLECDCLIPKEELLRKGYEQMKKTC